MEGVVVTDAASWAERDEARDRMARAGAVSVDERDDAMVVVFADVDAALAAALGVRSGGLMRTSRVAVVEGAVDAGSSPLEGPGIRRAFALMRLGRVGVLLA